MQRPTTVLLLFVATLHSSAKLNAAFKGGMIFHGLGRNLVSKTKFDLTPESIVDYWVNELDGYLPLHSGSFVSDKHQLHETFHQHFGFLIDVNDENVTTHVASSHDLWTLNPLGLTASNGPKDLGPKPVWNMSDSSDLCLQGSNKEAEKYILKPTVQYKRTIVNSCYRYEKGFDKKPENSYFTKKDLKAKLQKLIYPDREFVKFRMNNHNEVVFSAPISSIRAVVMFLPEGLKGMKRGNKIKIAPLATRLYDALKKRVPNLELVQTEFSANPDSEFLHVRDRNENRSRIGKLIPLNLKPNSKRIRENEGLSNPVEKLEPKPPTKQEKPQKKEMENNMMHRVMAWANFF